MEPDKYKTAEKRSSLLGFVYNLRAGDGSFLKQINITDKINMI